MKGSGNMEEMSTLTSKGQITIPVKIRKMLGLDKGTKVLFVKNGDDEFIMKKVPTSEKAK